MSIFGGTFKPFVIRQLKARQALMAYGLNTIDNKRSKNVQLYTTAKTSWIKMASFVDYNSNPKETPNDSLSRKYVLLGGTLWDNPGALLKPELKYGVDTPKGKGAYTSTDGLGHKPMPGIISVSINNEGAYGSLRSATINYKCWTKQQLDDLEILYMRTGYPVLLEWGWSMYLDTSKAGDSDHKRSSDTGDLNPTSTDLNNYIEKGIKSWDGSTINPFDTNKSFESLYDDIERLQFKYNGNYDGLVGIIKNFSYKLEIDGSYTCVTHLISMGDALASIKMNRPTKEQQEEDKVLQGYKTSFTALMSQLTVNVTGQGSARKGSPSQYTAPDSISNIPGIDAKTVYLSKYANPPYPYNTFPTYIQLAFLVALINTNFNTYLDGDPIVEIELPIYKRPGNLGDGLCLASADSVSIDPAVCIIKNKKATWIMEDENGYYVDKTNQTSYNEFILDEEASEYHNLGQIGNVYVCVQHVTKIFNDIMSNRESGDVGIYPFLKELLNSVSYALGGINSFDLYVTDSKAVIIDKNYTELPSKSNKSSKFELNIFGIDSVVRDFKIESKIFQSQVNQMAIGAGGQMNLGGVNTSTQDYFNRGLKNRLYTKMSATPAPETAKDELAIKVEEAGKVLQLTKYLKDFTERATFPFSQESIASANTYLKHILLTVNNDVNFRAIIPINVEITLDGIAGMAIGEVFRLNTNMLPEDYNRKDLGFMVTSLKQSIVNSTWLTTLGAYVILLDQGNDKKGTDKTALSSSKKADIMGYKGMFKAREQEKLEEYRLAYIRILHFLSEYFAGNVKVRLGKKVSVSPFPSGVPVSAVADQSTFNLTRYVDDLSLYIDKPKYVATNYATILLELGYTPLAETSSLGTTYELFSNYLDSNRERTAGYMGLLDGIKRKYSQEEALALAKKIIKAELGKSTQYKMLTEKAKPLADDILKQIDEVRTESSRSIKIEFRKESFDNANASATAPVAVIPIKPVFNKVTLVADYRERGGTPIELQYNPEDNIEKK